MEPLFSDAGSSDSFILDLGFGFTANLFVEATPLAFFLGGAKPRGWIFAVDLGGA